MAQNKNEKWELVIYSERGGTAESSWVIILQGAAQTFGVAKRFALHRLPFYKLFQERLAGELVSALNLLECWLERFRSHGTAAGVDWEAAVSVANLQLWSAWAEFSWSSFSPTREVIFFANSLQFAQSAREGWSCEEESKILRSLINKFSFLFHFLLHISWINISEDFKLNF
jgi:hypothetical protein